MLTFKPLTLEVIPPLRHYFVKQPSRICDGTVGGTFLWRDLYQTQYAEENGTLFLRSVLPQSGLRICSVPMDGDIPAALKLLEKTLRAQGAPLTLFAAREDLDTVLSLWPGAAVEELPDSADYLYRAQDLQELRGRHYAAQRNQISQFVRAFPDWRFEPIGADNLEEVRRYFFHYESERDKPGESFREDERKVEEVLAHYGVYGFLGGAIRAGGSIVAMAMGETRGDTLYVHIEKAEAQIHGAYQIIVREFSRFAAGPDVKYINREDDAGDPGLRRVKQSYKPCAMLEKYLVQVPAV